MQVVLQLDLRGNLINRYETIAKAARSLNVNESSIRKVLNKHNRTCANYIWKTASDKSINKSVDTLESENQRLRKQIELLKSQTTKEQEIKESLSINSKNGNVLVVGDLHEPFTLNGYFEFIKETRDKYNCGTIVFIGDIVDNYSTSRWDHDPDGMSAGDECELTISRLQRWYKEFPEAIITIGNHDSRMFKAAFKAGLPKSWIKDYKDIFNTPNGWRFVTSIEIDGVDYSHGDGGNGDLAALNRAKELRQSSVIGHGHSFSGVRFIASRHDTIFGMNVGCGVDAETYALSYAKDQTRRPVISCGVVLNNGKQPIVVLK